MSDNIGLVDIFNPTISTIAEGIEGKIVLIYGGNNLGKTMQATKFPKPYVIACEAGLNGISGVAHAIVNNWATFKSIVRQFTSPGTVKRAKEMYSTIIIDEVYASSLYCQDYVCSTIGDGANTLADGDSKHNLYQAYEKEYFKQINLLVNSGFTIVFIAHAKEDTKTGFISPKGDKRSIDPIIDHCDYVVYLKSNGVDNEGNPIRSSAYLAQTNSFFARSRIEYTPTAIKEFTADNLIKAIKIGIQKKQELEGATVVSFEEKAKQIKENEVTFNFEELVKSFNDIITELSTKYGAEEFMKNWSGKITKLTDEYLGKGIKVNECNENQAQAIALIVEELRAMM